MGCFGYICKHCNKSIRYGEKAVLKHVRHGQVIGEAIGIYDGYGRVFGNSVFRNNDPDNINRHEEICKSEFDLEDSAEIKRKIYDGKPISMAKFKEMKLKVYTDDEIYTMWKVLPDDKGEAHSGVVAYHKKCYEEMTEEEKNNNIPSKSDPNQSFGKPRRKFME